MISLTSIPTQVHTPKPRLTLKVLGQHHPARDTLGPPLQDGTSDSNGGISDPKWHPALVFSWGDSEAKQGQRVGPWSHSTVVVWPAQRWCSLFPQPRTFTQKPPSGSKQGHHLPRGRFQVNTDRPITTDCVSAAQAEAGGLRWKLVGSLVFCPPNFSAMWEMPALQAPPQGSKHCGQTSGQKPPSTQRKPACEEAMKRTVQNKAWGLGDGSVGKVQATHARGPEAVKSQAVCTCNPDPLERKRDDTWLPS